MVCGNLLHHFLETEWFTECVQGIWKKIRRSSPKVARILNESEKSLKTWLETEGSSTQIYRLYSIVLRSTLGERNS